MKKSVLYLLMIMALLITSSCTAQWTEMDIMRANSVEITCYSYDGEISGVYTISEALDVKNICNTFSLLAVQKTKITKPTERSYTIRFLDIAGRCIESVSVLSGHNVIESNDQLFKIVDEMDINRHIKEDILSSIKE